MKNYIAVEDLDECFRVLHDDTNQELLTKMEKKLGFGQASYITFENQFWDSEYLRFYNQDTGDFETTKMKFLDESDFIKSKPIDYL